MGVPVTNFGGFNTWAAWQGTPEKAAVAGDFTMLENKVEPVIKALIENGIEVVAVIITWCMKNHVFSFCIIGVLALQKT